MQPYKITVVKNNYYKFTTTAGITYACYFVSSSEYFKDYKDIADSIFNFNLELLDKKLRIASVDERISRTVIEIIKNFLEGAEDAVIYVCDSSDGKELLRKRKFDQWFKKYDDGSVIKIAGHVSLPDIDIYNALLIHKDNPRKNIFIEAFAGLNGVDEDK